MTAFLRRRERKRGTCSEENVAGDHVDRRTPSTALLVDHSSDSLSAYRRPRTGFLAFQRRNTINEKKTYVRRPKQQRRKLCGGRKRQSTHVDKSSRVVVKDIVSSESPKMRASEDNNSVKKRIPPDVDDAVSIASEESLLSAWSTDDDSVAIRMNGKDRIVEQFRGRDRKLEAISIGKGSLYNRILASREIACRRKFLDEQDAAEALSSTYVLAQIENAEDSRLWKSLEGHFIFELYHVPEGAWAVFWFCVGNAACACVFERLAEVGLSCISVNEHLYYGLIMALSLLLMRSNGYLWWWLGHDSYRLVKFDLHNRLRLGFWDARFMKFLSKPSMESINSMIHMTSFYGFYTSVYFYYSFLYGKFELRVWDWYESVGARAGLPQPGFLDFSDCAPILTHFEPGVKRSLIYHICTDPEWSYVSIGFHFFLLLVSALVMAASGGSLSLE